jgi:hypothetical protein
LFNRWIIFPFFFSSSLCIFPFSPLLSSYQEDNEAINQLRYQFETNYAPKELKEETLGWDLKKEIQKLKEARKFGDFATWRRALKGFFDSTHDGHVHVHFQSTSSSTLPFALGEADGRFFVTHLYKNECPVCPLRVGDEILAWNGEAIAEVVENFFKKEFGRFPLNRTSFELAINFFTRRQGMMGLEPESGEVSLDFIRGEDLRQATFTWETHSEYYPQDLLTKSVVSPKKSFNDHISVKSMLSPAYLEEERDEECENPFALGAKNSFIPPLGPILWQSWKKDPYHAYIFETAEGAKVGYLRIPHFRSNKLADFYCLLRVIRKLNEKGADLLIIDLFHNPGGDIFNLYAIASLLIQKPIKAFLNKEVVSLRTETALYFKSTLTNPKFLETYRKERKSLDYGYPDDERLEKNLLSYSDHILDQATKGAKISAPYPIMGIEEILPHPKTHFSGPILILIDSLDFSCGDLFPALLKDAGRVTLFGTRTGGAGGAIGNVKSPSVLGISGLTLTTSIVIRPNGKIIEGVGVEPDIEYQLTPQDFLQNFEPLKRRVLSTVDTMLNKTS